jgi:hypothetical protein
VSDTSQGANWWQASDGKWYPPESRAIQQEAGWWQASDGKWYMGDHYPNPPSPPIDPGTISRLPPTWQQGWVGSPTSHRGRWWLITWVTVVIATVSAVIVIANVGHGHTQSWKDGYRYGSVVAPTLDNSDTQEACGGDDGILPSDDAAQWQQGCVAGWNYTQVYASRHDGQPPAPTIP